MSGSSAASCWLPAKHFPDLPVGEVHVWLLLSRDEGSVGPLADLLSDDELERLEAIQSPVVRHEFMRGRTALRRLLGHYLDRPPAQIPLSYGERGKPELEMESDLHFNLSHNRGGTVIALGRTGALGVDIEELNRNVDLKGIARRFYAPAEIIRLEQSGWDRRKFFETWTCKEACLKAAGHGISIELSGIDTANVTAAIATPVRVSLEAGPRSWFVQLLPETPGYVSALACTSSSVPVKTWHWVLPDNPG